VEEEKREIFVLPISTNGAGERRKGKAKKRFEDTGMRIFLFWRPARKKKKYLKFFLQRKTKCLPLHPGSKGTGEKQKGIRSETADSNRLGKSTEASSLK
jgi:hypothetical protein